MLNFLFGCVAEMSVDIAAMYVVKHSDVMLDRFLFKTRRRMNMHYAYR